MARAQLSILASGPPAPIEIRDPEFRLVATGAGTHEMKPGVYLVQAKLPGRDPVSEVVTLEGGETAEVRLTVPAARAAPEAQRSGFLDTLTDDSVTVNVSHDAGLGADEEGRPTEDAAETQETWPGTPIPTWRLRVLTVRGLQRAPVPSAARVEVADPSGWGFVLHVFVPTAEAAFAQILTQGQVPVCVALVGNGIAPEVTIEPIESWSHRSARALPADDRGRLALEFLAAGQARSGAEVISAETASGMLAGKVQDPIGAALGGYLLLRLGKLEPMRGWVENLANWFPWLPDGAVISGELAAQEGEPDRALARFLELEERGLPLLTEGFSLALHRLRRYARKRVLPAAANTKARDLLERLRSWSPFVDLSAPTLTFRAAEPNDPARSQRPATGNPRPGDWVFDRGPGGELTIHPST